MAGVTVVTDEDTLLKPSHNVYIHLSMHQKDKFD